MKNAIEEEKVVMTADEAAFIDRFVAEHCRPHAVVMAERLRDFVAKRQMAYNLGFHLAFWDHSNLTCNDWFGGSRTIARN